MRKVIDIIIILCAFPFFLQGKTLDLVKYGAKGDGKTDNSFIISQVVQKLSVGDTLYVPQGIYRLKNLTLQNLKKICLTGEGTLQALNTGDAYFINIISCENIKIEGITIDCNNLKNLGIDISNSSYGSVKRVKIKNVKGTNNNWAIGLRLKKSSNYFNIENVEIINVISNLKAATGIYLYNDISPSRYIKIKDCKISNIISPKDADGIKLQQINVNSYVTVENSTFENNVFRAVKVQTNNVKIINNRIVRTISKEGYSIFSIYGDNVEIINNKIDNIVSSVNMFIDVSCIENVLIKGNLFNNPADTKVKTRDFLTIKKVSTDKKKHINKILIVQNYANNIRNFVRIGATIEDLSLEYNKVDLLYSNFLFVHDDNSIEKINIRDINTEITYKKYRYNNIYLPPKLKAKVIIQ